KFYFTHDAVSAGKLSLAARAMTNGVARDPERKGMLQRLDGCVQSIGHVRMGGVHASETRPAASAAGDRFIIRVMFTTARIIAAHRDIIHGATTGRWDALRYGMVQSAQNHVHDALRGLDIATGDSAREGTIDYATGVGDDLDRRHTAVVKGKLL